MGKKKKQQSGAKNAARLAEITRGVLIAKSNQITAADLIDGSSAVLRREVLVYHCKSYATVHISVVHSCTLLNAKDQDQIFSLVEQNMKTLYDAAGDAMPWDPVEKRQELFSPTSRYLIARNGDGAIQAYVHFKFEEDDEDEPMDAVLYLYEIQLAACAQRGGLGQHLMGLVEIVALHARMPKVMLTVFKSNLSAMALYRRKLSYGIDETSPSQFGDTECPYEILSLDLRGGGIAAAVAEKSIQAAASAEATVAAATGVATTTEAAASSLEDSGNAFSPSEDELATVTVDLQKIDVKNSNLRQFHAGSCS